MNSRLVIQFKPHRFYAPEGKKPSREIDSLPLDGRDLSRPDVVEAVIAWTLQSIRLRGLGSELDDVLVTISP